MRDLISKKLCGVLCFLLTFTWSGLPRYLATAHAATEPRAADLKHFADWLERMFQALEAAEQEIPRDTFDLKATVEKVGRDPRRLFEWVRDNTYLVPYRGTLRGWQGVLMDRLGNSLDRALLLGELLYEAGHKEARLAYAQLSQEQAQELLENARPIPQDGVPLTPRPSRQEMDVLLAQHAQQYDLDQAELRKLVHNATVQQQRLAEEAVQRTVKQAAELAAAVEKFRVKEDPKARIARLVETLRDHWWVQWKNGSQWEDLDPSLPDGRTVTQAKATFQGNKLHNRLFDEVHTLQIRLIIERWEKGRLVEVPVLTQQLWPFHLIGERIAIHHAPRNWPEDLDLFQEKEPLQALRTTVLAQREWVPVLRVGPHRIAKFSFTDTGEINDPTLPGFVQNVLAGRELVHGFEEGVEALGNRIKDILGGGRIGGMGIQRESAEEDRRSAAETNEELKVNKPSGRSQLTAEWIEYEMRVPGEAPRKIRRQIFDFVGPAARQEWAGKANTPAPEITEAKRLERGLALVGETEILPLVSHMSPQFVEHLVTENLLANRKVLFDPLKEGDSATPKSVSERLEDIKPLPSQLYGLALARREWSRFRGDVYLDRLNILSYHSWLQHNPKRELSSLQGFDIVANEMAVRLHSGTDPFLVRLEQGVLDTNVEALLAAAPRPQAKYGALYRNVANTAELFAASGGRGVEWLAMRGSRNITWEGTRLPKDIRARVGEELTADFIVIVPDKPVPVEEGVSVGWWRIHRETGEALGIGERGWGQTATEKYKWAAAAVLPGVVLGVFAVASCLGGPGPYSNLKLLACGLCGLYAFTFGVVAGVLTLFPGTTGVGVSYGILLGDAVLTGTICVSGSWAPRDVEVPPGFWTGG